jgi:acetylornithine deacetylase/succinyl-diaminopimelate desuccinylase-like protein
MKYRLIFGVIAVMTVQCAAVVQEAPVAPLRPDQVAYRALYKELPLVPSMSTGATDGIFLEAIGIPVYGAPGGWGDPDGNGVHGLNERRSVQSVYIGRDFLTDLVKLYADAG